MKQDAHQAVRSLERSSRTTTSHKTFITRIRWASIKARRWRTAAFRRPYLIFDSSGIKWKDLLNWIFLYSPRIEKDLRWEGSLASSINTGRLSTLKHHNQRPNLVWQGKLDIPINHLTYPWWLTYQSRSSQAALRTNNHEIHTPHPPDPCRRRLQFHHHNRGQRQQSPILSQRSYRSAQKPDERRRRRLRER